MLRATSEAVTSASSPQYWLPISSKLLVVEVQISVRQQDMSRKGCGSKSRCRQKIVSCKISTTVNWEWAVLTKYYHLVKEFVPM